MAAPQPCECVVAQAVGGENRNVYTKGSLLETVQRSNMFPDCKTFVDMKMRYPPERVLADFELFSNCRRNDGSLYFLQMFVGKHFDDKGSELENCMPIDWKPEPSFVKKICDIELQQFGFKLNELWKELCYHHNDDVKQNPQNYSSIYVPNPFIIPGGRFVEYYYWDSYWIVIGLLSSGMHKTAKGIIDNFLYVITLFDSIPSGGRIYYVGRSQPPLLIHMMKAYVDCTNDEKYAIDSLPLLEKEFNNFLENHKVEVNGYTMYQYRDTSTGPRPEAFREDVAASECMTTESEKEEFYGELKAACESGMDFSSRWFITEDGTNDGDLTDTKTRSIVPVDLNSILFRNSKILAEFNTKAGNTKKAEEYQDIACDLAKAIRDVLWNEEEGIWLDYDLVNEKPRPYFCASNFYPLWTRAFPIVDREKIGNSVMAYIESNKLDSYSGGVPNTLTNTNHQWDYPNVWPCMMYVIIEGLDNLGTPESKALSKRWGHRWIKSNYESYKSSGYMYQKYDCENFGESGGCSQNENPTGFGWSNGVAIYYLSKYGKDLCLADTSDGSGKSQKTKPKKECIITSDIQMPRKRELIITSEDNMNKLINSPCDCVDEDAAQYRTPPDESVYHTPKSEEPSPNAEQNLAPCQSSKSEQPPNANAAGSYTLPPGEVSNLTQKVETTVQVCQFCGRILGDEPVEENAYQSAEVPPPLQQESVFCPCESQADDVGPEETEQQDKSTSPYNTARQSRSSAHADKSTCICPDDEVPKLESESTGPVNAHGSQVQQEAHGSKLQQEDAKCCSCITQPDPFTDSNINKVFPLADEKSMGLCSDEKLPTPKHKSTVEEAP